MDEVVVCPLCSSGSFSSTSDLCLSLINVTSKWLRCTLCEEELYGLDKLTIHILTHFVRNTEFKHFFANNNPILDQSVSAQSINSEPLNLIKPTYGQPNTVSTAQKNLYILSSAEKIVSNDVTCKERENLKIDDEVMIIFKNNEKTYLQESSSDTLESLQKQCYIDTDKLTSSSSKKTQFTTGVELKKNINSSQTKILDAREKEAANIDYMVLNQASVGEPLKGKASGESSVSLMNSNSSVDLSFTSTVHQPVYNSVGTNVTISDTNENLCDLKKSESKNSFLSPKGERVFGYRCDVCSLVFPEEKVMLMHQQLIHVDVSEDPTKANRFKCHLCSKSFAMRGSLMVHMRVAHFGGAVVARLIETKQLENNAVSPELAQFVCSICKKGFRKEHQLIQHEKLHDGKQCDVCFKTFTTKYFLRKHKRLHTGEMPYSCHICNKSFTFQQSYHKHLLYHSDDKPYSCADCGRAFKELSTLHNHQRIHTGEKPFSCETCGKCFRQRVSYLVHRRIHTGVLPYKCQECGKKFRYKVSERTHKCIKSPAESNVLTTRTTESGEEHTSCLALQDNSGLAKVNESGDSDQKESGDRKLSEGQVINDCYPEAPDFFSLLMSPTDRLQNLSLSADDQSPGPERNTNEGIDTEALKQLLYDVVDYNHLP